MKNTFTTVIKSGTARSKDGAERDRGTIVHIIKQRPIKTAGYWPGKALCGVQPGKRSNGWHAVTQVATCEKCISKSNKAACTELVKKWIEDLIENGFMHGWYGDKSDEFKKTQYDCMMKVIDGDSALIGGNYRLLATIHSDYSNLKQYCGWKEEELKSLLALFGFKEITHVLAMMNCDATTRNGYMENGKLKKEVRFILTPVI